MYLRDIYCRQGGKLCSIATNSLGNDVPSCDWIVSTSSVRAFEQGGRDSAESVLSNAFLLSSDVLSVEGFLLSTEQVLSTELMPASIEQE